MPYGAAALAAIAVVFAILKADSSASEEPAVRTIVRQSLLTDRPQDCGRLYTRAALIEVQGASDDPFATCRDNADGKAEIKAIDISDISISGDRARATVRVTKGEPGLREMTIELRRGINWKIDRLAAVQIDLQALAEEARSEFLDDGASHEQARCAARQTRAYGEMQTERAMVDGSYVRKSREFASNCVGSARFRHAIHRATRRSLIQKGFPAPLAECVGSRAALALSDQEIFQGERDRNQDLHDAGREAMASCQRTLQASSAAAPHYAPEKSTAVGMTPQWRAFADQVDRICAVNFNKASQTEDVIYAAADAKNWSDRKREALDHNQWSRSQRATYLMSGRLGRPPAEPQLFQRWRANVGLRGRLFGEAGDAARAGDWNGVDQIFDRIFALKKKSDVLGRRFGLRICTSN